MPFGPPKPPAPRGVAADTAAYVMAKHCQRMAAQIERGKLTALSLESHQQLRDHVAGLLAAVDTARPAVVDPRPLTRTS